MNEARQRTRKLREISEGYVTVKKGAVVLAHYHFYQVGYSHSYDEFKILVLPMSRRLKRSSLEWHPFSLSTREWKKWHEHDVRLDYDFTVSWEGRNPKYSHRVVTYHAREEDVFIHSPVI